MYIRFIKKLNVCQIEEITAINGAIKRNTTDHNTNTIPNGYTGIQRPISPINIPDNSNRNSFFILFSMLLVM